MLELTVNDLFFVFLIGLVLIGILAYGFFQSIFGDYSESYQEKSRWLQRKCSVFKQNKRLFQIFT